jgi:23S rRNA (adenine2030-N6)-methyltransferase
MSMPAGPEHGYAHVFHAGNVGDVLKHVVLTAVLEDAARGGPVAYIDTHAGEGLHILRTTGEWTEGVYRLWRQPAATGPGLEAWLRIVRSLSQKADRPEKYPGSPLLAARLLDAKSTIELFETDAEPREGLQRHVADDARVTVHGTDGYAGLLPAVARAKHRRVVALCDPPYVAKEDWVGAAKAIIETHRAAPTATLVLWYPIKSWSRPHVLVRAIRDAGVPGATLELITTPLEQKRNRLNGSGLLCVNVSDALLDALATPLHIIGRACATQHGDWSLHVGSWKTPI